MNYERRFGGIARLYGEAGLRRLQAAHLCVVGIGGVGSWAAEALSRSGVGRLTLIDLDHVAESNLNRQVHALDDTLGAAKVAAMRTRIASINPACVVSAIDEFITTENVATLVPLCDGVVDAIDQVQAKAALIAHCRSQGIAVVSTGAAGGKRDPAQMRVDDLACVTHDPLAAKLRTLLRRDHGFPREAKKTFGVPCVYSAEPVARPLTDEICASAPAGLSCAGYGSSVCVTASFGFAAASCLLTSIADG